MIRHTEIKDIDLHEKLKSQKIRLGGNFKLKIYGTLSGKSGKRMKRENRVFFISVNEATTNGYRPCGHCMRAEYKKWKNGLI